MKPCCSQTSGLMTLQDIVLKLLGMAEKEPPKESPKLRSCDAYFEIVQRRKKVPRSLQENLTSAFARIPVSSFPDVPRGKGNSIIT